MIAAVCDNLKLNDDKTILFLLPTSDKGTVLTSLSIPSTWLFILVLLPFYKMVVGGKLIASIYHKNYSWCCCIYMMEIF